jgi:hypothetical protein
MKDLHEWTVGNVLTAWLIWFGAIAVAVVAGVLLGLGGVFKGPAALRIPLSWTVWLFVPPLLLTVIWVWRRARP